MKNGNAAQKRKRGSVERRSEHSERLGGPAAGLRNKHAQPAAGAVAGMVIALFSVIVALILPVLWSVPSFFIFDHAWGIVLFGPNGPNRQRVRQQGRGRADTGEQHRQLASEDEAVWNLAHAKAEEKMCGRDGGRSEVRRMRPLRSRTNTTGQHVQGTLHA